VLPEKKIPERKRGRPRLSEYERLKPFGLRLSGSQIERIKKQAASEGFISWQAFVKVVLGRHCGFSP